MKQENKECPVCDQSYNAGYCPEHGWFSPWATLPKGTHTCTIENLQIDTWKVGGGVRYTVLDIKSKKFVDGGFLKNNTSGTK